MRVNSSSLQKKQRSGALRRYYSRLISRVSITSHGIFFFQAEDGIRDFHVTGVQTCALPISTPGPAWFYAPLIGWGMLVCLHGLHAYELLPWTTQNWEQRKVRELIESRFRR